jgi:hypothetical protein
MLMPYRTAVFLWTIALIQQWPGLVLRASTSRYLTVIQPSTLDRLPEPIRFLPAESASLAISPLV